MWVRATASSIRARGKHNFEAAPSLQRLSVTNGPLPSLDCGRMRSHSATRGVYQTRSRHAGIETF